MSCPPPGNPTALSKVIMLPALWVIYRTRPGLHLRRASSGTETGLSEPPGTHTQFPQSSVARLKLLVCSSPLQPFVASVPVSEFCLSGAPNRTQRLKGGVVKAEQSGAITSRIWGNLQLHWSCLQPHCTVDILLVINFKSKILSGNVIAR